MLDIDFLKYVDEGIDTSPEYVDEVVDNKPKPEPDQHDEIITHLNKRAGTSFRSSSIATQKHISARLAEGYTTEDFINVIDDRCKVWLNDPKMAQFIRPATLFNSEKFESYLGQVNKGPVNSGGEPGITDAELEAQMQEEIERDLLGGDC